MNQQSNPEHLVAVVGAGPAGLFAARALANENVHVALLNRDIKPGGLAEYGIYPTKYKMKEGLRKQFRQIVDLPLISYYGNVTVGHHGEVTIPELRALGFQAILVTVGAQGTKWLGLPGEDMVGVYHAKDIVYHYNNLPPFSEQDFAIGRRVMLIGVGNVMLDIARWLIRVKKVDEVTAVARRGPGEVKFTKKELEYVAANLDLHDLDDEFERVAPGLKAVRQDVEASKKYITSALEKALPPVSDTLFRFEFLASPARIVGGERGEVRGLEVEDTTLVERGDGSLQAKRLGTTRVLPCDTVIFCIGDRVDESFGLPVRKNEFLKCPEPNYPVSGVSYEAFNPDLDRPIDRVFVAGWSREASSGLVGVARKDGENGAQSVLQYLGHQPRLTNPPEVLIELERRLALSEKPVVRKHHLEKLLENERCEAERLGLEDFKYRSNQEMLKIMGF